MKYHPTNFVESNALLALMEGETDEARACVETLMLGELYDLERAADELSALCMRRSRELRAGLD